MKYNKQTKNSISKANVNGNGKSTPDLHVRANSSKNSAPVRQNQAKQPSGKRKMQEKEITLNLGGFTSTTHAASSTERSNASVVRKSTANKKKASKNSKNTSKSISNVQRQPQVQTKREQQRQRNAVKHKRRTKRNYTLHYILLIVLLIITIVTLSYTVLFNINKIEITDNKVLSDNEIIAAANVKVGDNLLKINKKKIELNVLNATIFFDKVKVERKFPSTLKIDFEVATPVSGVKYGGMYYYFSKNNRLIEISKTEAHKDVPIAWGIDLNKMKLGEYLVASDKNEVETVQMLYNQVEKSELKGITAIDVRDPANIRIYYEHRVEIQLGSLQDIEYKLKIAKEILSTKIEAEEVGILDVQIVGKAYFRVAENTSQPQ